MSFPYLDLIGFKLRSAFTLPEDVDMLEARYPGFVAQQISDRSSYINARLRKRYGYTGQQTSLPFGQTAPALQASGTAPPAVTLIGRPTLGSVEMQIQITTGGPLATAVFQWSSDGGKTFTSGVTTAAAVVLGITGMSALFPIGTYATDNHYAAAEPVPAIILQWLTAMVAYSVWNRRGRNPQDPFIEDLKAAVTLAVEELTEAANSKDGLFDLPVSEDLDSAITTGGPLGFSDSSPYAWQTRQARLGRQEDHCTPIPAGEAIP